MIKRIAIVLVSAVLLLLLAVGFHTLRTPSRQLTVQPVAPLAIDEAAAAARLAGALTIRTVSSADDPEQNAAEFEKLHAYLEHSFPRLHASLKREVVGGRALLYTWQGSDPAALPVLWMAHQDVVPIAPNTEKDWQQPPFDGLVKDGFIWGRGSWDDKGNLLSQMEAVERLLESGFRPRRTIYLAYGSDEEVGGKHGAVAIAALLKSRGVRLDYVLDEGMLVTEGVLKGLDKPAALIGVAEKGYATVHLHLSAVPGHSSMPPNTTAIGAMSAALDKLERHPYPANIQGVSRDMFDAIGPEMTGFNRVVLTNLWLFSPVLRAQLEQAPGTNAIMRTTTALTMMHAGNKDNVLPGNADAAVNFRLLPGDTLASVLDHVRQTIGNDAITLSMGEGASEPSRVSRTDTPSYQTLNRTVREIFPTAIVAPGLMLGATDSRHFEALSDNIFKFSPVRATLDDLPRFHGTNERLSVTNYAEMIRFYRQLLLNSDKP